MVNWTYVGFLTDGTFIKGSATHLSHPVLCAIVAIVSIVAYVMGTRSVVRGRKEMITVAAFALAGVGAVVFWPSQPEEAPWRQGNFLCENVMWAGNAAAPMTATSQDIFGLYPADLDGEPIVELGHDKTNVLLVVLEGISGAYLDSVADAHGVTGKRPRLPELDSRAKESVSAINFFNHQRQTNRGLYSVHCGDLPKQGSYAPKMSELGMGDGTVNCLPAVLARHGYETVFIQAAPLSFMGKDKFMPRAGFGESHGSEWFQQNAGMGRWGMDDLSLFKKATGRIEELRKGGKPWMVSILTAGTHHPFTVPEDFVSGNESGSFAHAVDYLNVALQYLFGYLESSGVLEDTIVVFTSDESFGIEGTTDADSTMFAQAFGTFTAMLPQKVRSRVVEPFAQTDVAVSILDYLGYTDNLERMGGRSVFRSYRKPRAVPFANTYMRMVGALSPEGYLYTCYEDYQSCRKYRPEKERYFSPRRVPMTLDRDDEIDFIREIGSRSLWVGEMPSKRKWLLADLDKDIEVAEFAEGERVDVFSNQYLSVKPGQVIDVDIEFEIKGDPNTRIELRHGLYAMPRDKLPTGEDYENYRASEEEREKLGIKGDSTLGMRPRFLEGIRRLHRVTKEMQPGQLFRVKYSYGVTEAMERLSCAVFVWFKEGKAVTLRFSKATLAIRSRGKKDRHGKRMKVFKWGFPDDLKKK